MMIFIKMTDVKQYRGLILDTCCMRYPHEMAFFIFSWNFHDPKEGFRLPMTLKLPKHAPFDSHGIHALPF